jgi:hypothetical protein
MTTLVNARLGTPTPLDGWLQIESGVITGFGPGEPPRGPARSTRRRSGRSTGVGRTTGSACRR